MICWPVVFWFLGTVFIACWFPWQGRRAERRIEEAKADAVAFESADVVSEADKLVLEPNEQTLVALLKAHEQKSWAEYSERLKQFYLCDARECAAARAAGRN